MDVVLLKSNSNLLNSPRNNASLLGTEPSNHDKASKVGDDAAELSSVGDDNLNTGTKKESELINLLALEANLERFSTLYTNVIRDKSAPCTREQLALHLGEKDLSDHECEQSRSAFTAFIAFIVDTFRGWRGLSPKLSQTEKDRALELRLGALGMATGKVTVVNNKEETIKPENGRALSYVTHKLETKMGFTLFEMKPDATSETVDIILRDDSTKKAYRLQSYYQFTDVDKSKLCKKGEMNTCVLDIYQKIARKVLFDMKYKSTVQYNKVRDGAEKLKELGELNKLDQALNQQLFKNIGSQKEFVDALKSDSENLNQQIAQGQVSKKDAESDKKVMKEFLSKQKHQLRELNKQKTNNEAVMRQRDVKITEVVAATHDRLEKIQQKPYAPLIPSNVESGTHDMIYYLIEQAGMGS